uniref:Uncharacterized protein n=1 Tax=Romanomermis culicivorax TaxID=13658 RepID=A0A915IME4_ROMCU
MKFSITVARYALLRAYQIQRLQCSKCGNNFPSNDLVVSNGQKSDRFTGIDEPTCLDCAGKYLNMSCDVVKQKYANSLDTTKEK